MTASVHSEFMLLLPNVDLPQQLNLLFLQERRLYELQCLVLAGWIKSRRKGFAFHCPSGFKLVYRRHVQAVSGFSVYICTF